MDSSKTLNTENRASCKMPSETENLSKIRNSEFSKAFDLEEQLKDICEEKEDKPDDTRTKTEAEIDKHSEILAQKDKVNACYSPLKKMRKVLKSETVASTKPDRIQKNIKFRRAIKGQRQRAISLRRKALLMQTNKKLLSQIETHESNKSQTGLQDFQNKTLRIANKGNAEKRNNSSGISVTKPPLVNKIENQAVSSSRSQEVSTNKNLSSTQPTSEPIPFYVTTMKSQASTVTPADKVWSHFRSFLRSNTESLNVIKTDGIGRENNETSDLANNDLKHPPKTAAEYTNQSLKDRVKTTDYVTTEQSNNCTSQSSETEDTNSASVLTIIQQIRQRLSKKMKKIEENLRNISQEGQTTKNIKKRIKFIRIAKTIQAVLHRYYDTLCDQQMFLNKLKINTTYSIYVKHNLFNSTSLMDLQMSAKHVTTFSSLFLCLQKSLNSEFPTENVFKRMKFEKCAKAYQKYRERKAICEGKREISETVVTRLVACFNVSLEECHSKMNLKIPDVESGSLEDYQNHICDLKIAVNETLNFLNNLLYSGSSVIFPVMSYMGESRANTCLKLLFLDKIRPNVFPE